MTVYPAQLAVRAREHFEAGWKLSEIVRLIEREYGRRPNWRTVKSWVDPEWADRQKEKMRPVERRRRERHGERRPRTDLSDEFKLARMRDLRDRGISYHAIGQVAAVWWGEELNVEQVSSWLGRGERRRAYRKQAAA